MASSRNKFFSGGKLSNQSSNSSGLRIFWIPGRHKRNSKGRFDSPSKRDHKNDQKKSDIWSLGGSKTPRGLLDVDPDSNLFDGPSVSGVSSAACALGAVGAAKCANTTPSTISASATEDNKIIEGTSYDTLHTPSSTTSTTPLVPNSPDTGATPKVIVTTTTNLADVTYSSDANMPAKTTFTTVATTTTAEIIDENRFSILGKDISNDINVYDLPLPPQNFLNTPGTESATITTTALPPNTPNQYNDVQAEKDSMTGSPSKKKNHHKNENNNHQNDINCIESISDNAKIPSDDLEWIDELLLERNSKELSNNKKKKKKKISTTKELDQLDGIPIKLNTKEEVNDDDEKVVKCLYYTLMCCECTIS